MNDLLAMGFDEGLAQAALRRSGGNVDQAIDLLLSNSVVSSDAVADRVRTRDSSIDLASLQ